MKFIQGTCLNAVLAGFQTSIFPLSPEEAIDENSEIRDIVLFVNMLDLCNPQNFG